MTPLPDPIYLDYNATTPILPEVREAMLPFLSRDFGNPSSNHLIGARARQAIETARQQVAELLGCTSDEVIFTSGGTEANNLALLGVLACQDRPQHLITSIIEHPAIEQPCRQLEKQGWQVTRIPVDATGLIDCGQLTAVLRDDTVMVTIMHANNEIGTIQPLAEIAALVHERGGVLHTDAAQSVAKVPTRVDELGVDLLSVAGHKLYAPKGIGALYIRRGTPIKPILYGAGHERGLRPGTENVPHIVALGQACALAQQTMEQESRRIQDLRDRLLAAVQEGIPQVKLNGHPRLRLPNTLNLRVKDQRGSTLLARATGIAASTGSACHEGGEQPSPVLTALGLSADQALGSIRLSLGRLTTEHEVDRAAAEIIAAYGDCLGSTQ